MQTDIDQTRWYDRIWASFIFFTRLPFWRLHEPPRECFKAVVEHWPLVGWLTGGLMALTLWGVSQYMPYPIAVLAAIVVRLLVTGALHEDGLADFLDGFGGGNNRERILAIMKDSHIGTYGVIGLVFYFLLLAAALCSMAPTVAAVTILVADPFAKMVASELVMMMPYARREDEAKARMVYRKIDVKAGISLAVQGLLPIVGFIWLTGIAWELLFFIPCIVMYFLYLLIWRRIRGYTGDCCGAVCLLVELTVILVVCSQNVSIPEL
ncbi:MAG: adenosylcobinamide-GDP ribazoletransferase [Prevotella sp.]|nr:adenosylcobinamide-GDP ribazoletransferase [Prevotella sp.]